MTLSTLSDDNMDKVGLGEVSLRSQSESDDEVESEVEVMLTAKLIEGFVLLQTCCPTCNTPLVKSMLNMPAAMKTEEKKNDADNDGDVKRTEPIHGVSYCVSCCAHVMTNKEEMRIMQESAALTGQSSGEVLLAMSNDEDEDDFVPTMVMDTAIAC